MKILISMLSGENGVSSKRSVMVFLLLLFAFALLYNLFTGKSPSAIYQEQHFELLLVSIASVFGERLINVLPTIRGKKTVNENESK